MLAFIARRLLALLPVLWGIATLVFVLMYLVPGDPARLMAGQNASEQTIAALRRQMGLDRPVHQRYALFLAGVAKGELGYSYRQRRPVTQVIFERFPATLKLALASILIALVVGVGAGVIAARFHGGFLDWGVMAASLLGISTPVFWLGLVLIVLFSVWLGWLPVGGYGESGGLRYLLLPAVSLSAISTGYFARITRSSFLEVLASDFVLAARTRGIPEARILGRHVLRNAAIPLVTVIGTNLAGLLGGAVATETVFAWPGIGRAIYDAILLRDLPVVEGGVIFLAFIFVVSNLVIDLLYAWIDPRVRLPGYQGAGGAG
ncbi:MAG TPA: ABC transporter permease, partial [Candidatus Glassbacteria bacterium]|nr:ABC transporter permease [Candidatus Glassbacteria bacterium]